MRRRMDCTCSSRTMELFERHPCTLKQLSSRRLWHKGKSFCRHAWVFSPSMACSVVFYVSEICRALLSFRVGAAAVPVQSSTCGASSCDTTIADDNGMIWALHMSATHVGIHSMLRCSMPCYHSGTREPNHYTQLMLISW